MRVSEIGVYSYGGGWSVPGVQAEVGRLEFADAGVLIELSHLRQTGTFDYRDRDGTLGEWTRNNPVKTGMLVLVGFVVAVTAVVRAVAGYVRRKRERDRLKAEEAARLERLKAEEAARPARLKAEEAAKEARKRQEAEAAERGAEGRRQRDEFRQQLKSSSVDRLRFEYEKRQRSIQALHAKIAERNHVYDENEELMSRYPDDGNIQISCLDARIFILDQLADLNRDIANAEREMSDIQQTLDTKWR